MRADKHFQDASYWIAKAPPFPFTGSGNNQALAEGVVLQFPTERIRHGQDIGLAGGCMVLRPSPSQAWRWRHRRKGVCRAG